MQQVQYAATRPKQKSRAKATQTLVLKTAIGSLTLVILFMYLLPLIFSVVGSLKSKAQASDANSPILPSLAQKFTYNGEEFDIYNVPLEGGTRELALVKRGRSESSFVDPSNPGAGVIVWKGVWRTLSPAYRTAPQWDNYPKAFNFINFLRLLSYTLMYASITTIAAVGSAALVAYGFARFQFPFKNAFFVVLVATIILPPQVTSIPTYALFYKLGWIGSWLPLIIPQFFSNAYNVFLLRQYFMTIPRESEESAKIDGAGPIRIFFSIMLPQAVPALIAVGLFHFFFAWNDFFGPLVYLAGNDSVNPLSLGLFRFNGLYSSENQLVQAASVMTMILPLTIFFFAQRFFIQGVVTTGVDK
jgi:multiple sugar transport system permease protein